MKKSVIFAVIISIFLSVLSPLGVSASYNNELSNIKNNSDYDIMKSDIVYIVCTDGDRVIFDKNFDKVASPASLVKIMTTMIAIKNCKDLSTNVTFTQNITDYLAATESTLAGFSDGEVTTMKDLLFSVMVESANDSALAVALAVSGSEEAFVKLMNDEAKRLGCDDTHFTNCTGLESAEQKTTAHDMYIITKEALSLPVFEEICDTRTYTMKATNIREERTIHTTNLMLSPGFDDYYLSYAQGVKSAVSEEGRAVITRTVKDGYTYIAIVMGGKYEDYDKDGENENGAFIDCGKALQWIYNNIRYKVVAEKDQTICVCSVIHSGKTDHVRVVPVDEVYALVPYSLDVSGVYFELSDEIGDEIKAPVKSGEIIGTATVYYGGNSVAEINVTVAEDIHYSLLNHIKTIIKNAWSSVLGKIIIILVVLIVLALIILKRLIKMKIIDVSEIIYNRKLKKHLK